MDARRLPTGLVFASAAADASAERIAAPGWSLDETRGRLVELSGHAALTLAFGLVLDAQRRDEPIAWISSRASHFFPPDAAAGGVDLDALPVVRVDGAAVARAADQLGRSGAFGLLVLDLGGQDVPPPLVARLAGIARAHDATVLCLTEPAFAPARGDRAGRELGSRLGSLVSLRIATRRRRDREGFVCELRAVKDKRRAPGWVYEDACRGPAGT